MLQMTSSVEGLMVSKVRPSTLLTHSLLMKLGEISMCVCWACCCFFEQILLLSGAGYDLQSGGLLVSRGDVSRLYAKHCHMQGGREDVSCTRYTTYLP